MTELQKQLIAFAHYSGPQDISGVTTWLQSLLVQMHLRGYSVIIYLLYCGSSPEEGSIYTFLKSYHIPVVAEKKHFFLEDDVRSTLNFLNSYRPSLFLPQCLESFHIAAHIAGHQGLPWIQTLHADEPVYWFYAKHYNATRSSGKIVGVSQYLRNQLSSRGLAEEPIAIPPGGINKSIHSANFRDTPFRVVYSGRIIEEQKKISLVIRSMLLACKMDHRIECWLVGDGSYRQVAQEWVAKSGFSSRFKFFGRVDQGQILDILKECQIILLLSDYEGFGLAIAEAMGLGLVPIVRDIPAGIPEMVIHGKTGILVDDNPSHIANQIVKLLNDSKTWYLYSQAAMEHIHSNFSQKAIFNLWVDLIWSMARNVEAIYPLDNPKVLKIPLQSSLTELHRRRTPICLFPLRLLLKATYLFFKKLERRLAFFLRI